MSGITEWLEQKMKEGDPRVQDWALMDIKVVMAWIAFYLVGIFVTVQIMKPAHRKPFKLKWVALLHNAHLCLLSLYMCVEVLRQAYLANYSLFGNGVDRSEKGLPMARIIWIFYASKIAEFGDTFIMALKKNFHQISFLHLYHHTSIFFIWWVVTFWAPGGESYFSAALNSFIHVLMYGYYFWSTVDGWNKKDEDKAAAKVGKDGKKPRLTPCQPGYWRQSITTMQMTQFTCMFIQACYNVMFDIPGYPRFLGWVLFFYMLTMLGLFANFFIKAYTAKPKAKRADANGDATDNGKKVE